MRRPRLRSRSWSRIRSLTSAVAILAALCATPRVAGAQDVSTEASAAFDQGTQYFARGRYALALESFQTAYRLRAHPAVLLNIATSLDRLGRPVEAVAQYLRYRRLRGSGIEPERRRFVEDALRRLGQQVALLLVTPPAPGAAVAIDGSVVEIGEDPVVVPPGPHRIEARADDGRTTSADVLAVGGRTHNVVLRFATPAGPAPAGAGLATPGAPGNGENARGPDEGGAGHAGGHESGGWNPALRWVGLGATAVFGGLMIFTGARTLSLADEYNRTTDPATKKEGLTYRAITEFVFFPATLLAAGFTVLAFVFAADGQNGDDEAPPARAALLPTPDGFVLAASGSF
jgi:hypothetical protein